MTASTITYQFIVNPAFNLRPMPIDDSTHLNIITWYTSDALLFVIYVTSKNSVSTLATPCGSPQTILLPNYDQKIDLTIMRNKHSCVNVKKSYYNRLHDGKRRYQKSR